MSEEAKKEKGFSFVDKRKSREQEDETVQTKREADTKEEKQPAKTKEAEPGARTQDKKPPLPEIDFNFFILSLSSSAMMQMGIIPNPITKKKEKNLDLAKQSIDIIAMLEKKTKGNLTPEEAQFIESILYDLRIQYVEVIKGKD
mgnify:CR=1 FL=1